MTDVKHDYIASNESTQQMLGDMYRVSVAIEAALKYMKTDKESICIEKAGDITIFKDGQPFIQIETKHHLGRPNLINRDLDLWKTLRNWVNDYHISSKCKKLIFHTTSVIAKGSLFKFWIRLDARQRAQQLKKASNGREHGFEFKKYYNDIFCVSKLSPQDRKKHFIKLYDVLSKVELHDCQVHYQDYTKHVLENYDFFKMFDTSCGSAIFDEIHKNISEYKPEKNKSWAFSFSNFQQICKHAMEKYPNDITSPGSYPGQYQYTHEYLSEPFVQEIKKLHIVNEKSMISRAISYFRYTKNEITSRFTRNPKDILNFKDYESAIENSLEISQNKYVNRACLNNQWIQESHNHYFECLGKELIKLDNFHPNNTEFQQGTMHWIVTNKIDYNTFWYLEDFYEHISIKKTDTK